MLRVTLSKKTTCAPSAMCAVSTFRICRRFYTSRARRQCRGSRKCEQRFARTTLWRADDKSRSGRDIETGQHRHEQCQCNRLIDLAVEGELAQQLALSRLEAYGCLWQKSEIALR